MESQADSKPLVYQEKPLASQVLQAMVDNEFHVVWPEDLAKYRHLVQGILSTTTTPINSKYLESFPAVKIVSNFGVGYDHINVKECRASGVRVGNTAGTLNDTTADMAFALLLATARRVVEGDKISKDGSTIKLSNDFLGYQVSGKTIGIVGMGRIGREIAKRAHGFSMKVLYHNRNQLPKEDEARIGASYLSMPEVFAASDFVVISIPGSKENWNVIGRKEFSKMKPTSVFVNIGRGSVVDQEALVEALKSGVISAAGLDVTSPEPLPRDHPLLQLPNVIISPHTGSATLETRKKMAQMAMDNLFAGLKGDQLVRGNQLKCFYVWPAGVYRICRNKVLSCTC